MCNIATFVLLSRRLNRYFLTLGRINLVLGKREYDDKATYKAGGG